MERVFLAYSPQNRAFAQRLAQDLSNAGLQVWADFGVSTAYDIQHALQTVDCLIVCLSSTAIKNPQVQAEIITVRDRGGAIVPLILGNSLAALQASKELSWLSTDVIIHFQNRYEQAFAELLQAIPTHYTLANADDGSVASVPNPFKGLEAFQQIDAAVFFGREDVTRLAINRLRETHFLAVVGASGTGKSSLVRAGVIPQIRQGAIDDSDTWTVLMLTPGAHPLDELARCLQPLTSHTSTGLKIELRQSGQVSRLIDAALQDKSPAARLLLVIDQFEEVFTQTGEIEREQFLDIVRVLSVLNSNHVHMILTMRADYFGQLSHYPDLAKLFEQPNLLALTEMPAANLIQAIESPAQAVGLRYEAGLVERLSNDTQAVAGSLPRLQYALYQLSRQRSDTKLTLSAYTALGGVQRVIAHHADTLFKQLDKAQQDILRQVLLMLIDVSEAGDISVRRISRDELVLHGTADSAVQPIVDLLATADSRLIIIQRRPGKPDTIQLAHEALINAWDRLQQWVESSLDELQFESELRRAADNWNASEHDEGYLLRDKRLTRAANWLKSHYATTLQRSYIQASIQLQHRERIQARVNYELRLQHRATRRTQVIVSVSVILLVSVVMLLIMWLTGGVRGG